VIQLKEKLLLEGEGGETCEVLGAILKKFGAIVIEKLPRIMKSRIKPRIIVTLGSRFCLGMVYYWSGKDKSVRVGMTGFGADCRNCFPLFLGFGRDHRTHYQR